MKAEEDVSAYSNTDQGEQSDFSGIVRHPGCEQYAGVKFKLLPASRDRLLSIQVQGLSRPLVFRGTVAHVASQSAQETYAEIREDGVFAFPIVADHSGKILRTARIPCNQHQPRTRTDHSIEQRDRVVIH